MVLETNIQFKSNLFIVLSEDHSPYNDIEFIREIFDPQKLGEIQYFSKFPNVLTEMQKEIIKEFGICLKARKLSGNENYQCFVFTSRGAVKGKCKCKLLQCEDLLTKCRKGENRNTIEKEIEQFGLLKQIGCRNTKNFYPIITNFDRVLERHKSYAYELLSNTDLEKYKQNNSKQISFAYTGGCENWDNWAGGDPNNYFSADRGKEKIQQISIDANTEAEENPLFKFQRENNKNRDNPFFNS